MSTPVTGWLYIRGMRMKSRAAVYVATRRNYIDEANQSAASLRLSNPEVRIYLKAPLSLIVENDGVFFDNIIDFPDPALTFIDKHMFLDGITEDLVVFLDGDTHICRTMERGFRTLDRFDFAAAHAPVRSCLHLANDIPPIPEFNTGVIFCQNTNRMRDALARWPAFVKPNDPHDQAAFQRMIWASDLSFYVLPPEFNARICFPLFVSGEVAILHGRMTDPRKTEAIINAARGPRTFHPEELL